jgi:hypothetical protein
MTAAEEVNALTSSLSVWEYAAYVSILAVAIGVLGEVIHDFTGWFKTTWWKEKGDKYSAILLVVALFAELIIQAKENSISGRIIAILRK